MNATVKVDTKKIKTKEGKDFEFDVIVLEIPGYKGIEIKASRTTEEELLKFLVKGK